MFEKLLRSSKDPQKISLAIRGVLLGFVTIFLAFAPALGLEGIDANILTEFVDGVTTFFQQLFALISTVMVIWGLIRKVLPSTETE